MKILIIASNYPYSGHPASGIFNERCAMVLRELCDHIEVVSPRPYVPPLLSSLVPRWKAYSSIKEYERRNEISVHRPASPVIPYVAGSFWFDRGAFFRCRQRIRELNDKVHFDAIISFDLLGAGGIAWRAGQDLGIPACGWATGDDVLIPPSPAYARVVIRALERLDLVFYQSQELMAKAAGLLGTTLDRLSNKRHMVLPRGIPAPPRTGSKRDPQSSPCGTWLKRRPGARRQHRQNLARKSCVRTGRCFFYGHRPKSQRGLPAHRFTSSF